MRIVVRKWGNSAAVRIPASVMAEASLELDQAVDVRQEGGRIVIEPVRNADYDLDAMLDAMRPETFPKTWISALRKGAKPGEGIYARGRRYRLAAIRPSGRTRASRPSPGPWS